MENRSWALPVLVLLILAGVSVGWSQSPPPVIFYTDLQSGPNSGGETQSGFSGAYVTLYGNYFGASQGSATVTLAGASCLRVVFLGYLLALVPENRGATRVCLCERKLRGHHAGGD